MTCVRMKLIKGSQPLKKMKRGIKHGVRFKESKRIEC